MDKCTSRPEVEFPFPSVHCLQPTSSQTADIIGDSAAAADDDDDSEDEYFDALAGDDHELPAMNDSQNISPNEIDWSQDVWPLEDWTQQDCTQQNSSQDDTDYQTDAIDTSDDSGHPFAGWHSQRLVNSDWVNHSFIDKTDHIDTWARRSASSSLARCNWVAFPEDGGWPKPQNDYVWGAPEAPELRLVTPEGDVWWLDDPIDYEDLPWERGRGGEEQDFEGHLVTGAKVFRIGVLSLTKGPMSCMHVGKQCWSRGRWLCVPLEVRVTYVDANVSSKTNSVINIGKFLSLLLAYSQVHALFSHGRIVNQHATHTPQHLSWVIRYVRTPLLGRYAVTSLQDLWNEKLGKSIPLNLKKVLKLSLAHYSLLCSFLASWVTFQLSFALLAFNRRSLSTAKIGCPSIPLDRFPTITMANNPSKVGREGAAPDTLNEQADIRVHKPVRMDWFDARTDLLAKQLYSPLLGDLRFVLFQLHIINEAGAFTTSVYCKLLEWCLLDDSSPFPRPRTPSSGRLFLEHAIITKIYKIVIKKREEKKIFEAKVRKTLGLDKGDTPVDNTAYTNCVRRLVEMTIQHALNVKLEMQRISHLLRGVTSSGPTADVFLE